MIYTTSTNGINVNQLNLKLLNSCSHIVLAIEENSNQIVGYITAISDGVLSAYIPFLEVLPSHHGKNRTRFGKENVCHAEGYLYD